MEKEQEKQEKKGLTLLEKGLIAVAVAGVAVGGYRIYRGAQIGKAAKKLSENTDKMAKLAKEEILKKSSEELASDVIDVSVKDFWNR